MIFISPDSNHWVLKKFDVYMLNFIVLLKWDFCLFDYAIFRVCGFELVEVTYVSFAKLNVL